MRKATKYSADITPQKISFLIKCQFLTKLPIRAAEASWTISTFWHRLNAQRHRESFAGIFSSTDESSYREPVGILAGAYILSSGGVRVEIEKIFVHGSYTGKYGKLHNIAVVRLKTPLVFSNLIKPIELYQGPVPVTSIVIYSGWGTSDSLKFNHGDFMWSSDCARYTGVRSDYHFCLKKSCGNGLCDVSLSAWKLSAINNHFYLRVTLEVAHSSKANWSESPATTSVNVDLQSPMSSLTSVTTFFGLEKP